jgi:hypothetical protein
VYGEQTEIVARRMTTPCLPERYNRLLYVYLCLNASHPGCHGYRSPWIRHCRGVKRASREPHAACQFCGRGQFKRDGTRPEIRFRLSAKRASPFKSAGASVQSTAGSRGVRINGSNAGYTMFRGSVKSTGYPIHSPVSPSILLPCVTVCHHISTGLYQLA